MSQENVEIVRQRGRRLEPAATSTPALDICDPDVEVDARAGRCPTAPSIAVTHGGRAAAASWTSLGRSSRSRSKSSSTPATRRCLFAQATGRGSGVEVRVATARRLHAPRRQDRRASGSSTTGDEALKAAGLRGVGDVAGERGDRAGRCIERFERGDWTRWRTADPDFEMVLDDGRFPEPGTYRGLESRAAASDESGGLGRLRDSRTRVIDAGEHVVVLLRLHGAAAGSGIEVTRDASDVCHLPRRQGRAPVPYYDHEPKPSKPPGCRSRRCRRRTWRSCGESTVCGPRRHSNEVATLYDPDVELVVAEVGRLRAVIAALTR